MSRTLKVAAASSLVALAVTALLWYLPGLGRKAVGEVPPAAESTTTRDSQVATEASPFAVATIPVGNQADAAPSLSQQSLSQQIDNNEISDTSLPDLDVTQIGQSALNDADFESLVARLQKDPALLQQLIDEFRQEQKPERLALLARLLGEAGGTTVTQVAGELIFSGNAASRALGLQLLQQVQPGNSQARDIASGLLATEVEPGVLVSTLTALASPGTVDADSRGLLSDQVALLAAHDDAGVRGISLDILSRWSTDGRDTPVLVNGLLDSEPRVREAAAYALVGHEDPSGTVVESLLSLVNDVDEEKYARRAAVMALRGMPLNDSQRGELQRIERQLDTVTR